MTRAAWISAKLSEEDAVEIIRRCDAGEAQHVIAAAFGVNQGRISEIVQGKRFPARPDDRAGERLLIGRQRSDF